MNGAAASTGRNARAGPRPPMPWIASAIWAALLSAIAAVLLQAWLMPACSMLLHGPLFPVPECLAGFLNRS